MARHFVTVTDSLNVAGGGGYPPGGPGGPPGPPPGGGGYTPPPGGAGGGFGGGFSPPPGGFSASPPGGPPPYAYPPAPGRSWSPVDALVFGWNALTKNFVGVGLAVGVAFLVIYLPGQLINGVGVALGRSTGARIIAGVLQVLSAGVGFVLQAYIMGGVIESALRTARGGTVQFADVWNGGRYFLQFLIATLLYAFAVSVGTIFCFVPGLIVAVGLGFYGQLVVDRGLNGIDALKESWELTKGHKFSLCVYALLCIPVVFAGALLCGVGALLGSLPVIVVASAYIYLKLRGEEPRLPT